MFWEFIKSLKAFKDQLQSQKRWWLGGLQTALLGKGKETEDPSWLIRKPQCLKHHSALIISGKTSFQQYFIDQGFWTTARNWHLGLDNSLLWGWPVHRKPFSGIPGLYLVNVTSTSSVVTTKKCLQILPSVAWPTKLQAVEIQCYKYPGTQVSTTPLNWIFFLFLLLCDKNKSALDHTKWKPHQQWHTFSVKIPKGLFLTSSQILIAAFAKNETERDT